MQFSRYSQKLKWKNPVFTVHPSPYSLDLVFFSGIKKKYLKFILFIEPCLMLVAFMTLEIFLYPMLFDPRPFFPKSMNPLPGSRKEKKYIYRNNGFIRI